MLEIILDTRKLIYIFILIKNKIELGTRAYLRPTYLAVCGRSRLAI